MNYFNVMMYEGYEMLIKRKVKWPKDMKFDQKVSLYQKEIDFWREQKDYDKCVKLQNKLSKLYSDQK